MIYWINGAYGAGKTTAALSLKDLLPSAHLFDPEMIGNAVRENYPETFYRETFEEYPLWLEFSYRFLKELNGSFDGDIIVPMTLLRETSYDAILQKLKDDGAAVRYVFLDADAETLRTRLIDSGREEPDSWCVRHIPACLNAQKNDCHAVHINSIGRSPDEIAREIAQIR